MRSWPVLWTPPRRRLPGPRNPPRPATLAAGRLADREMQPSLACGGACLAQPGMDRDGFVLQVRHGLDTQDVRRAGAISSTESKMPGMNFLFS